MTATASAAAVHGDRVAAAFVTALAKLGPALEHGWLREVDGMVAGVTGVPVPSLNGVLGAGEHADPDLVDSLLDEVAASGVPHCLAVRPGARHLEQLAMRRGMTAAEQVPIMELADLAAGGTAGIGGHSPDPDDLSWQLIGPADRDAYLRLLARGFESPIELFAPLVTAKTLCVPGLECLVGNVGGEGVTTAMAVTIGDAIGVFNVATPPELRRRGYAAAATTRCLLAGREAGAHWAFLQSSPQGLATYRRLGFEIVEQWQMFVNPGSGIVPARTVDGSPP
jgi:ribosomal protein S18 acetylase RimI-like enzyme